MNIETKINSTTFEQTENRWDFINIEKFFEYDFDIIKNMNNDEQISFLQNIGLIKSSSRCVDCNIILNRIYTRADRHPFFRCTNKDCSRKYMPIFKNSIFEKSRLTLIQLLQILYYFSCRRSVSDASECLNISKTTIIDFYKFIRSALFKFLDLYSSQLGGHGIVVHFDETPITHRHGLLGRHNRSNTVWVVGAVDIYTRKCFLKFLPSRSRNDLYAFLNNWILPGSTIHTDCHRSYSTLSNLGFTHFTVNHSVNLVSPDGIHTNWIEGIFGCLKKLIRKYDAGYTSVENLELYLAEFCYRYSYNAYNRQIAFLKIFYSLKKVRNQLDLEDN